MEALVTGQEGACVRIRGEADGAAVRRCPM